MATRKTKEPTHIAPRLYNLPGAAAYSGLSMWSLRAMVRTGALPVVEIPSLIHRNRTARRIWIAREDLDALIAAGRTTRNVERRGDAA
jgi:hypothetical protein